jgi:hypothetical protein
MNKKLLLSGISVFLLVLSLTLAGCGDGAGNGSGNINDNFTLEIVNESSTPYTGAAFVKIVDGKTAGFTWYEYTPIPSNSTVHYTVSLAKKGSAETHLFLILTEPDASATMGDRFWGANSAPSYQVGKTTTWTIRNGDGNSSYSAPH